MRELAARIPANSPLVINAVNPGLCRSELVREMRQNFIVNMLLDLMMAILARTTEQGGRILLHAAVSTEPEKMLGSYSTPGRVEALKGEGAKAAHGKFFHTCRITEESDYVISEEGGVAQKRLWVTTLVSLHLLQA